MTSQTKTTYIVQKFMGEEKEHVAENPVNWVDLEPEYEEQLKAEEIASTFVKFFAEHKFRTISRKRVMTVTEKVLKVY